MSMLCWAVGVTPAQILALRATPSLASDLAIIAQDDATKTRIERRLRELPPEGRSQAEARFRAMDSAPEFEAARIQSAQARSHLAAIGPFEGALDLEKSWHILHFLFTGNVGPTVPPADTLLTGEELGADIGYGPARLHNPDSVEDFSGFLRGVKLEELQARVDIREMASVGVYAIPAGGSSPAEDERDLRAEVGSFFAALRDYVAKMAEKHDGLLIWLI